jgi:hypothetical protein
VLLVYNADSNVIIRFVYRIGYPEESCRIIRKRRSARPVCVNAGNKRNCAGYMRQACFDYASLLSAAMAMSDLRSVIKFKDGRAEDKGN